MKEWGYKKEYNLWLVFFILVNIISGFLMYKTGLLVGDLESLKLYDVSVLIYSLILVILCYYFYLFIFFNWVTKLKIHRIFSIAQPNKRSDKLFSYLIALLQVFYVIFNISTGVNTAGALNIKTDSLWSFFWVLVPIDTLFLVYYGFHRDSPYFKYNIFLFVISNLIRGWTGVFFFIAFFEWCRAYRLNKINFIKLSVYGIIVVALYPFILNFKWVIRSLSGDTSNLSGIFRLFTDTLSNTGYAELFQQGITQLTGRLQQTSVLIEIIHNKTLLQTEFEKGNFLPFWSDGLPQLIYRKLLGISAPPNIGIAITNYLLPDTSFELGSYNISIGYMGWFFISPLFIPLYLIYTVFLSFISVFLIKQLEPQKSSLDVLWLAWLVYLLAGWLLQFIAFIYGILIFIILRLIVQYISRIRLKSPYRI
jgi:hypothetical protein